MKNVFSTLLCLLTITLVSAQPGFLAPANGGAGTLSGFQAAANTITAAYTFPGTGTMPLGTLAKGDDGLFYGMTRNGGTFGKGAIFSFNRSTSVLTTLKNFNADDGENPSESLIVGAGGKLFGMTINGGINGMGVIFSYNPATAVFEKIYDFASFDGAHPNGSLTAGNNHKLYGMTTFGGDSDNGIIFDLDTATVVLHVLKNFSGTDGSQPNGSLMIGPDGRLFGTTLHGGNTASNGGVIFTYDRGLESYTVLRNMDVSADGGNIYGDLTLAGNGKLYGMASVGGIFSIDPAIDAFAWVRPFGVNEGSDPNGNLTLSTDGKLYGMTPNGGANGLGVIFSYNPANSAFTVKPFTGANGSHPDGCSLLETDPCQPPVLTCPATQNRCFSNSGTYTIPPLQLSATCGSVLTTFEITGATNRNGVGTNASGAYSPGTSNISWIVIDQSGNTHTCQTTVNVATAITVTIPDATVASPGAQPNTVYRGYLPASFIVLQANPTGGTGPYTYTWSNGAHTPFIIVSPTVTTTYTVTVTDSKGCTGTAAKQVKVVDVRCGNHNDKVEVCIHVFNHTSTICVNPAQVLPLLLAGGTLGSCTTESSPGHDHDVDGLQIKAYPNPSANRFTLDIRSNDCNERALLTIRNTTDRVIERIYVKPNEMIQLGANYKPGVYFAELIQGRERITIKLVKL
jgi:uncharacterized repeat protein (TIGR03803 family)